MANSSNELTNGDTFSSGARRMARYRKRRRNGLRCITLEIRESEIDTLIRRGRLPSNNRSDTAAIKKALYSWLDDELG